MFRLLMGFNLVKKIAGLPSLRRMHATLPSVVGKIRDFRRQLSVSCYMNGTAFSLGEQTPPETAFKPNITTYQITDQHVLWPCLVYCSLCSPRSSMWVTMMSVWLFVSIFHPLDVLRTVRCSGLCSWPGL